MPTKLLMTLLCISASSGAFGQIGGLPEAANSSSFGTDGTRDRMIPNIVKFFGSAKGWYFDLRDERSSNTASPAEAESAARQFLRIFNDQPGGILQLPDGNQITFATRTRNSSDLVAAVTPSGGNTIISIGILHNKCGIFNGSPIDSKEFKTSSCQENQTFTIIWGKHIEPTAEINAELASWIQAILREQTLREHTPRPGGLVIELRASNSPRRQRYAHARP